VRQPPKAAPEHLALGLNLPKLDTAEACSLALDRIAAALCAGTCGRDAAGVLVQAIQLQLHVMDIQRRLAELERRDEEGDWWKRG
jgi:hypothetical protein